MVPAGDIFAIEEKGSFYLAGPTLECLTDAEAVLSEARRALDQLTATISLLCPELKKPTVSNVFRETERGTRDAYIFVSDGINVRSKVSGNLTVAEPQQALTTQAQDLLSRAKGNQHLENALTLWADPMRSWPRLYRILEEIELQLGRRIDDAGFCISSERERFARTANTAEVAGPDARHAAGKFSPPAKPMTIAEANRFIGKALLDSLR